MSQFTQDDYLLPEGPAIVDTSGGEIPTVIHNLTVSGTQTEFVQGGIRQGFIGASSLIEQVKDWVGKNRNFAMGAVGVLVLLAATKGGRR